MSYVGCRHTFVNRNTVINVCTYRVECIDACVHGAKAILSLAVVSKDGGYGVRVEHMEQETINSFSFVASSSATARHIILGLCVLLTQADSWAVIHHIIL